MLHQDARSKELLGQTKQMRLHLCWKQYIKTLVCLNTQRYVITRLSSEVMWQCFLRNIMLTFEQQRENTSTIKQFLWQTLTRSFENSYLTLYPHR